MQQYWAKHQGRTRWGVKVSAEAEASVADATYRSQAGHLFIWADELKVDDGALEFRNDEGRLQAAVAPGAWIAVFEAAPDDTPASVETE